MAVNIKEFKVKKEERQVREYINTPQGAIEIYEPRLDDIAKIIDFQKDKDFVESGVVEFNGVEVVRNLFPLLTNIEFNDLSDEELADIIENPSIHLLIAQQVIAQIVAEANKLYAQRVKTELMNSESTMVQVELMNSIPAFIIEKAKGDGKVAELVKGVEKAQEELDKAIEREDNEKNEGNNTESND